MKKIYIYTFKKLNEVNSTMNIQQKVPFGELQRGTVRVGGDRRAQLCNSVQALMQWEM